LFEERLRATSSFPVLVQVNTNALHRSLDSRHLPQLKEFMMPSNLTRFDPFGDVARFDPFNGLENFFRDFRIKPALSEFEAEPRIKMDISETDKAYTIKAEIPGVKKEDIKVDIARNQVSISVETNRETEQKEGERVVRSERYFGRQYRSFTLPQEIDDGKAGAKYHDGILELALPKKAGNGGKKLVIS
jgi:HSP20 family protein